MPHFPLLSSKRRSILFIIALILLGLSLSGCVTLTDYEASQEYTSDSVGTIDSSTRLGQSFISRRPILNGVTIWITIPSDAGNTPASTRSNPITIKLYTSAQASSPIYATTILAPASGNKVPVNISIPAQNNPSNQEYYLEFSKTTGYIEINGRNADAYPDGHSYINGQPINGDIAFQLNYDYGFSAFLQDINQNLPSTWLIFPLLILLLIPGYLLLDFSGLSHRLDFGERVGISLGISMAFIPLLMLWTTILGIRWTQPWVLFFAGLLAALWLIRVIYRYLILRRTKSGAVINSTGNQSLETKGRAVYIGTAFLLVIIFISALAIRLIMVRDLATPAWVDSVHHALITRLILLGGKYPSTYLPYWDFNPSSYHPGFHSIAAAFTWLTRLDLERSLLVLGQVLNALVVFPVYLLAKKLTGRSTIGLVACLITGFVTPMPAYYTSWGRYTELAGLLILPAAFVLVLESFRPEKTLRRGWIFLLADIT